VEEIDESIEKVAPLKKSDYSEDIELELRKQGKDYCARCGNSLHGSEISPARFERVVQNKEDPTCPKCRNISSLKKRAVIAMVLFLITVIVLVTL
jgi:hypothetical protein